MKRIASLPLIATLVLASSSLAQHAAPWELLDSPVKVQGEITEAGESLVCSLPFPPGVSLFDCDKILGTSPVEFLGDELYSPFTVWHFDETCSMLGSWTTAFPGTTMTGLTFDEQTGTTYWVVDPFATSTIAEYAYGTGVPTGVSIPLAAGYPGVWGGLAIDTHAPGKFAYCEDVVGDIVVEYDLISGTHGPSFPNPDNHGVGAFGNDVGDAADPAACFGAALVMTSGLPAEFQVVRASQVDKDGTLCYETWLLWIVLLSYGETFVNGIEEFYSYTGVEKHLLCMGNVTGAAYILRQPVDIAHCQGVDSPASDVLFVNGDLGGPSHSVSINPLLFIPIGGSIQKPLVGGNGRFVVHLNVGAPSAGTLTTLPASLGRICHPLLLPPAGTAAPVAVWNNLGRTASIGASTYFGVSIPDPAPAPTFFWMRPVGDPLNLPLGSVWTIQGVVKNPAASSPKAASVTNAILLLAY